MKKLLLLTLFIALVAGCKFRDSEIIDINGMEIHSELVDRFMTDLGKPYELFIRCNWISDVAAGGPGLARVDTIRNGIIFKKVSEKKALKFRNTYKDRGVLQNKYIFFTNTGFSSSGTLAYDIVIVKANNQFQALKIMNTHGLKQGISHTRLFDFIVALHENNPINIFLLEENRIGFDLEDAPDQSTKDQLAAISPSYELRDKTVELYWPK